MTRGEKGRVEPLDQPDDWCVRRALLTEGEAYRSILPLSLSRPLFALFGQAWCSVLARLHGCAADVSLPCSGEARFGPQAILVTRMCAQSLEHPVRFSNT
jgi:hypothetical protein